MPDDKVIKSLKDGEGYKYLGVLQADEVQVKEMKGKVGSEYKRRVRKILETKLNGGNVISLSLCAIFSTNVDDHSPPQLSVLCCSQDLQPCYLQFFCFIHLFCHPFA